MNDLRSFGGFEITNVARFDRNKIYYGFIHNYSSPHTREAYTRDLKSFLRFLSEKFKNISEVHVEHAHVVAFKDGLLNHGKSQRSINRALATLWSFYDHLQDLELVSKNPVERVKRFSIPKMVKTQDLKDEEVSRLLNAVENKLHKALLTLFFTTGMRHREVSHLKFKSLGEENGLTVIRYMAKGAQERVLPLNPQAEEELAIYLADCESRGYRMLPEDYIFRSSKDSKALGPLDPKSLNYIIKKYAKKIGVTGNITIHSARSTVIGMLLDKGHPLETVADFVGHKDISMTKAYNKRRRQLHQSIGLEIKF